MDKDKEVKNRARNDKPHFIDEITTEAEEAAGRQYMKTLHRITKCLNGDYGASQDQHVNDKYGRLISDEKGTISRWKKHFQSILNRPKPATTADIQEAEDIDVNLDLITEI